MTDPIAGEASGGAMTEAGATEASDAAMAPLGAPPEGRWARLRAAVLVYTERRVLLVMLLGFSSGLPLALSGSTLALRMADRHVALGTIGLFALVGLPYTLKFLWAPLIDAWHVPLLTRRLGRRRGWLVLTQLVLAAAIVWLALIDAAAAPWLLAAGALAVAAASATQDTVIDAFRVESLRTDEQAAGMAGFVAAYRVAMLLATAGVVALVAILQAKGYDGPEGWTLGYVAMAALVGVGLIATLFAREPAASLAEEKGEEGTAAGARLVHAAVGAFVDFLAKPQAWAILAFVVLFKFCDAFAGHMIGPFVLAIGFDKATYAEVVKGVGLVAALAGGFAGGALARAVPMAAALWIGGILQAASNLVFSWQALVGPKVPALIATVTVESFTGAVGTVIFVAYLSGLCRNAAHTATQFALLTALAAVGRTVLSSLSGYAAATVGWPAFFALAVIAALPGLALLAWLQRRGHFAAFAAAGD
jgi:PAT family beta-lactamase induction signal transducer AmpG